MDSEAAFSTPGCQSPRFQRLGNAPASGERPRWPWPPEAAGGGSGGGKMGLTPETEALQQPDVFERDDWPAGGEGVLRRVANGWEAAADGCLFRLLNERKTAATGARLLAIAGGLG